MLKKVSNRDILGFEKSLLSAPTFQNFAAGILKNNIKSKKTCLLSDLEKIFLCIFCAMRKKQSYFI